MKFVKRISLFFIFPLTMFAIGFACNMLMLEYFYPGDISETPMSVQEIEIEQVSVKQEPIITANTILLVQKFDSKNGFVSQQESVAPDMYIGMTRNQLYTEIQRINQNPPLSELEEGFSYIELSSFSPEKVVIRKTYTLAKKEEGFFLLNENHMVVVYEKDLQNVYMTTNISVEELPQKLQEEIIQMKYIESEKELYNFLESYSS